MWNWLRLKDPKGKIGIKIQVLLIIRNGACTEDDWNLLLTRTPNMNKNIINPEGYARLSFLNENLASDNYKALQSLDVPIAQITARHSSRAAANLASDDIVGLGPRLFFAISAYDKSLDGKRTM